MTDWEMPPATIIFTGDSKSRYSSTGTTVRRTVKRRRQARRRA